MRQLILFFIIHISLPTIASPQSWVECPLNGHWYALTANRVTWLEGEAQAIKAGGHLATIRNGQENAWISNTFGQSGDIHIGYSDEKLEGAFVWISGEKFTYSNWDSGEPNNCPPGEDYVALYGITSTHPAGTWNDIHNGIYYYALIEVKAPFYSTFGDGCKGTGGVPQLLSISIPRIGKPFCVLLTNVPLNMPGFMVPAARSNQNWSGLTLPFSLTPLGMIDCSLYVSLDIQFAVIIPSQFGAQVWGVQVPNDPHLVGATFFNQAFYIDPKANPAGFIATNPGFGVIGI